MKRRYQQVISYLTLQVHFLKLPYLIISLLMGGVELGLLWYQLDSYSIDASSIQIYPSGHGYLEPLEYFLDRCYFNYIALLGLLIGLFVIFTLPSRQCGSDGSYKAFYRIPLSRYLQFILQTIASFGFLLLLWLTQFLIIGLGSALYTAILSPSVRVAYPLGNAILNSTLLQRLFPVNNGVQLGGVLLLLFSICVSLSYCSLRQVSKSYDIVPFIFSILTICFYFHLQSICSYGVSFAISMGIAWITTCYTLIRSYYYLHHAY